MHHKVVLFPAPQRSTFAKRKIARTQDIERRITKPSSIAIKNNFALKTGHSREMRDMFHVHCWTGFINLNPVF